MRRLSYIEGLLGRNPVAFVILCKPAIYEGFFACFTSVMKPIKDSEIMCVCTRTTRTTRSSGYSMMNDLCVNFCTYLENESLARLFWMLFKQTHETLYTTGRAELP